MNKQDVLNKLIPHYELVIGEAINMNSNQILKMLVSTSTHLGICNCALERLKVSIYDDKWVTEHCNPESNIWLQYPGHTDNKTEIISRLQFRLDKMREILSSCE